MNRRRVLIRSFGLLLMVLLAGARSASQGVRGEVRAVEINGDEVTILYDLQGSLDDDYLIGVFLVPVKRPDAARELEHLRGDAGKGRFAGIGRKILWNLSELPGIMEGESFVFRITVDRPGIPWYYWAGGGVALAGGAAAILLKGNSQGGGGGGGQTPVSNPLPPSR